VWEVFVISFATGCTLSLFDSQFSKPLLLPSNHSKKRGEKRGKKQGMEVWIIFVPWPTVVPFLRFE